MKIYRLSWVEFLETAEGHQVGMEKGVSTPNQGFELKFNFYSEYRN